MAAPRRYGLRTRTLAGFVGAIAMACSGGSTLLGGPPGDGGPRSESGLGLDGATNDASSGDASPDGGALEGAAGPRGLFIPSFHKPLSTDPTLSAQVQLPYVDGLFVSRRWKDIEPTLGNYTFDTIGADLRALAAAGKKASLGIGAGANAPDYICTTAGVTCLSLVVHPPQTTSCMQETLPLPWDPVVLDRFGKMVAALGQYILTDATLAATVVDVKVTGFNEYDEETILGASTGGTVSCTTGNACSGGQCTASDMRAMVLDAGLTDPVATATLVTLAGFFRNAFSGVPIGSQVSFALQAYGSSLPFDMVQAFVTGAGRPITVQDNGLAAVRGVDPGTLFAEDAGVPVGYQMLASVVVESMGPACLMGAGFVAEGGACDESVLRAAIDNGIDHGGARWLEIYSQDVAAYPDAAAYAHTRLVGP